MIAHPGVEASSFVSGLEVFVVPQAFIVAENLYNLGCRDVAMFGRRPLRFAVWDEERSIYTDNAFGGLKVRPRCINCVRHDILLGTKEGREGRRLSSTNQRREARCCVARLPRNRWPGLQGGTAAAGAIRKDRQT